jgi:hypothetical protein
MRNFSIEITSSITLQADVTDGASYQPLAIYLRSIKRVAPHLANHRRDLGQIEKFRNKFPKPPLKPRPILSKRTQLHARGSVLTNPGVSLAHEAGHHKLHAQDTQEIPKTPRDIQELVAAMFQSLSEPQKLQ